MTVPCDVETIRHVTSLVDFLAEVTDAAERDPVRDIESGESRAPSPTLWLDKLPDGIRLTSGAADDVLLRVRPQSLQPEPLPPAELAGWVDSTEPRGPDGVEPDLLDTVENPPVSVVQMFTGWASSWRIWAVDHRRALDRRKLYEQLEHVAKTLEQQDDEYEFVLAVGFVSWTGPNGTIRRHLVSEPLQPKLDRASAEVSVSLVSGKRRVEDKELFADLDEYQPDRARAARQAILDSEAALLDDETMRLVRSWLATGLTEPVELAATRSVPTVRPVLSPSPAFLLRPRSQALLAETYKRIAATLREPDAQVPVALAQLVVDTEPDQRDRWLTTQGAAAGDILGKDPLFPLPTNDEQLHVIELLRAETGVVVQGPPGTGKTHTIANLVAALLARGQRVLVTSQKDQALKVLREKIPLELRKFCVLLAGGSKDAAKELERGIEALSEAVANPNRREMAGRAAALEDERDSLRSHSAELNTRVGVLRDVENVNHDPVVPGFSQTEYRGRLTDIVRKVKRYADAYDWIPPVGAEARDVPPLSTEDLLDLLRLLRSDSPHRRARATQVIPDDLPPAGRLAQLIEAERTALATSHEDIDELTRRLAGAGVSLLDQLTGAADEIRTLLRRLGYGDDHVTPPDHSWISQAVADRLARRNAGLWGHLMEVRAEANRLQDRLRAHGVTYVIEMPSVRDIGIGVARGWLNAGKDLREHLDSGRRIQRRFMPRTSVEKAAEDLLAQVRVDGQPPTTPTRLAAALDRLEAEVAAQQLVEKWADAGVPVAAGRLTAILSQLADYGDMLGLVDALGLAHQRVVALVAHTGLTTDLSTVDRIVGLLDRVPPAQRYLALEQARAQVGELRALVGRYASMADACPELVRLGAAIGDRDLPAYQLGLAAVAVARDEQADEQRRGKLARTLRAVHPRLFDLLDSTAGDEVWDARLANLPAAWAWSRACQYVARCRNTDEERRLTVEYDQVEDQIRRVTEELAATEAMRSCLERMTDMHSRALNSYREHMSHVGAGTGKKASYYRRAARAAMEKAKDAVPAWVVPLPDLLANISATHNAFDVVIVDEASQVSVEHLYLLWMAPRVIVVGDDKQCTPGGSQMTRLDDQFKSLAEHLAGIDPEIRMNFTSKSNLYGLLSARSGKNSIVRLREHFRCMPEIINWSSSQFYGDAGNPGLVPLRERTARDLDPLRVVQVTGAYTEGRDTRLRNPVEARQIVATMVECLEDPRYRDKTFGVVVLRSGTSHIQLLEHEINLALTPEQRQKHKVRVGTAPNFQGDERDVIFLSTVVSETPNLQASTLFQQSYNVASTRAKDQMWLFTSLTSDQLKPGDLRASLIEYMRNPPSVYGISPDLNAVSVTVPCDPFESLFEQRVFREIKRLGYHVVPQYRVGRRSLDLVVVGAGGRLAVECDGHPWHTSPNQQVSDARRDRELRRMGWDVVRIRESEFEFDATRELTPLWERLTEREISPNDTAPGTAGEWQPVALTETDEDGEA